MLKSTTAFALTASLSVSACATGNIPYNPANSQSVPDFAFVETAFGNFAELDHEQETLSLSDTMKAAIFIKKDGEQVVIPCDDLQVKIDMLTAYANDPKLAAGKPRITAQRDELMKASRACGSRPAQGPVI